MSTLGSLTIKQLMQLYRDIGIELVQRGVCRTSNSPVGDVAEHLFSRCFGWKLEENSRAGFDACDPKSGTRFQIKSRFLRTPTSSRQAGDIRDLAERRFDWLAAVVFDPECDIDLALLIPHHAVLERAAQISHTRSHRIHLRPDWLSYEGVRCVKAEVSACWKSLNGTGELN